MSDEELEEELEGFSASEDEWKPSKKDRGGESSDDDDSEFEDSPVALTGATNKRREPKGRNAVKQTAIKKRKPTGQSLRTKLYNKYRPPPKTASSPSNTSNNSPSAGSSSRTASKNANEPNAVAAHDDASSDSSVEDYLVNPAELDFKSSFFNTNTSSTKEKSPAPVFDCNAGIGNLSDSGSEDNNESSAEEEEGTNTNKAFDFRQLLEKANSLERTKETIKQRTAQRKAQESTMNNSNTEAMDVNSLLALGENKQQNSSNIDNNSSALEKELDSSVTHRLSKTKSTRVKKRVSKTRPTSKVVAGDTDDSDWEEVADDDVNASDTFSSEKNDTTSSINLSTRDGLEILVDFPTRKRGKAEKSQQDAEMILKRKLNRDLRERQLLLHKTSLLCCFGRSYFYNRLLNDISLIQAALKLLPSNKSYPPKRGTELKYFQSLVIWYKTAIKLTNQNLYPEVTAKKRSQVKQELLQQITRKEARCKQDMVFIFVTLLRGMGLQCRLVVNLQPLPLKPAQSDLIAIKLKRAGDKEDDVDTKKPKHEEAHKIKSKNETENIKKQHNASKEKLHASKSDNEDLNKNAKAETKTKEDHHQHKKTDGQKVTSDKATRDKEKVKTNKQPNDHIKEGINSKKTDGQKVTSDKATDEKEKVKTNKQPNDHMKEELNSLSKNKENLEQKTTTAKAQSNRKQPIEKAKEEKPSTSAALKAAISSSNSVNKPTALPIAKHLAKQQSRLSIGFTPIARRTRQASTEQPHNDAPPPAPTRQPTQKPIIEVGSPIIPKIILHGSQKNNTKAAVNDENRKTAKPTISTRDTRSRSKSPRLSISPKFMQQSQNYQEKFPIVETKNQNKAKRPQPNNNKIKISAEFLKTHTQPASVRVLRSRQKTNSSTETAAAEAQNKDAAATKLPTTIPQLDGADDDKKKDAKTSKFKRPQLKKLNKSRSREESDEDFEPSPTKKPKQAPKLPKALKDRRILSTDDDELSSADNEKANNNKRKATAADMWVEVWSDVEEQWICVDLFKGKLLEVDTIRKAASSNLSYVYAFQNDLSIKDVTARYCINWTTAVRRLRVEQAWLNTAISAYYVQRTKRDIRENEELRSIHEKKPIPTTICEYKDNPLYALERHLLKFQAIYPPDPPTLGFVRGEPVFSRDCVHTLHSRDIWLKQARTVKLGEKPYKIVLARPKWDRLTQTVIKDQPLEIFGFWQTQEYEPPTAENGLVPRNAYGNVELFKECMLPKKTVHLRLPGLNRICKKLGIDCANAVVGFDFHQGACHPMYDGFIVCEEFTETVTDAWHEDQNEQSRKEVEKYEARVYGNWKKLIRGLLIRERLKKKYNF